MLRYKINISTFLRSLLVVIVFFGSLIFVQNAQLDVVLAAPPVCYTGSGVDITSSECGPTAGSLQSSRTYRDATGASIDNPVDDKCYLRTSDASSSHIVYTEQSDCEGLSGTASGSLENDCNSEDLNQSNCGIIRYLVLFINVLSSLAGIVIVGSIIYAGIQYSASGNDPQKISASKERIRNAIIALLFFIFGYGLLNYLIPGGVF